MHRYVSTHMHLHTTFEAHATMRSQAYMARKLGIKALFITDHDTRMGYLERRVNAFSYPDENPVRIINTSSASWQDENGDPLAPVQTEKGWALPLLPGRDARFFVTWKQNQASLLADITFFVDFLLPNTWEGGLRLDFELSLKEDSSAHQHFYYDMGDCPQEDPSAFRKSLPKETGPCRLTLPLSQDILAFDPLGQDNCFITLHLRTFGSLKAFYLGHEMPRLYAAEAVRQRQQALADEISRQTGIAIHVATEISGAGQHKLSPSKCVPLLDYPAHNYQISWETAAAHVKKHGGIFAYNHMFEPFKRQKWEGEAREQLILDLIERLKNNKAEGAALTEIGFPEGRSGFSPEEHLRVWDALAMEGVLLSGYGDSDCHNSQAGWMNGNNFATFWYAQSPRREDIEKALPTGNAYTLDPARMQGIAFGFSLESAPMGGILIGGSKADAALSIENLPEKVTVQFMAGGQCQDTKTLAPGHHEITFRAEKNAPVCPVRVEIRGMDGRLLLLSNPVYWADADLPGYEARPRKQL